jgi:hypothetical protein
MESVLIREIIFFWIHTKWGISWERFSISKSLALKWDSPVATMNFRFKFWFYQLIIVLNRNQRGVRFLYIIVYFRTFLLLSLHHKDILTFFEYCYKIHIQSNDESLPFSLLAEVGSINLCCILNKSKEDLQQWWLSFIQFNFEHCSKAHRYIIRSCNYERWWHQERFILKWHMPQKSEQKFNKLDDIIQLRRRNDLFPFDKNTRRCILLGNLLIAVRLRIMQ